MQHTVTPKAKQNYRHLVSGQDRRENSKELINIRHQIPLSQTTLLGGTKSIEVPFRIPLPADLPSSFFYAGDRMSLMKVEYFISYQFLGLEPDANGVTQQPRLI